MAAFGTTFSAGPRPAAPGQAGPGQAGSSRAETLRRLDALAQLLDGAFAIPGTNVRFGLDAVIGLVPGIGDLVTTALSSYIIWEARRLGLPRWKIARMIGNVALDATVGIVPLVGDLMDVAFKANRRNLRIIRDHFRGELGDPAFGPARPDPGVIDAEYRVVETRR
jgi:hypothetical protein